MNKEHVGLIINLSVILTLLLLFVTFMRQVIYDTTGTGSYFLTDLVCCSADKADSQQV